MKYDFWTWEEDSTYLFSTEALCAFKRNSNYSHSNRIIVTNHYARDIAHLGNIVHIHKNIFFADTNQSIQVFLPILLYQQVLTGKNIIRDIYWKISVMDQASCATLYFRLCYKSKNFLVRISQGIQGSLHFNLRDNSHLKKHGSAI